MWKAHHSGPLEREATWVLPNLPKEIFTEKHSQKAHHRSPPEREASYRDVKSTSQQSTSKRSHMSVKFAKRDFHGKAFSTSTPQKSTWKRSLIPYKTFTAPGPGPAAISNVSDSLQLHSDVRSVLVSAQGQCPKHFRKKKHGAEKSLKHTFGFPHQIKLSSSFSLTV